MDIKKFVQTHKKNIVVVSSIGACCIVLLGGTVVIRYNNYNDLMLQASEYPEIEEEYGDLGLFIKKDTLDKIENDLVSAVENDGVTTSKDVEIAQKEAEAAGVDTSAIDTTGMNEEEKQAAYAEATAKATGTTDSSNSSNDSNTNNESNTSNNDDNTYNSSDSNNNNSSSDNSNNSSDGSDSDNGNSGGGSSTPEPEPIPEPEPTPEPEPEPEPIPEPEPEIPWEGNEMLPSANESCHDPALRVEVTEPTQAALTKAHEQAVLLGMKITKDMHFVTRIGSDACYGTNDAQTADGLWIPQYVTFVWGDESGEMYDAADLDEYANSEAQSNNIKVEEVVIVQDIIMN